MKSSLPPHPVNISLFIFSYLKDDIYWLKINKTALYFLKRRQKGKVSLESNLPDFYCYQFVKASIQFHFMSTFIYMYYI